MTTTPVVKKVSFKEALIKKVDENKKMEIDENDKVQVEFAPLSTKELQNGKKYSLRRMKIPKHRFSPLRNNWPEIVEPLVKQLKLQVRCLPKKRTVELRTSKHTTVDNAIERGMLFLKAFILGFELRDALAVLRIDNLYIDTVDMSIVPRLKGDHLSRAIGRVAGQDGKTKFTIENATRTRLVVAGSLVHMLGAYKNLRAARVAVSKLAIGSPPSKVYTSMRALATRMKSRF